jgi:hypothetical protein
MTVSDTTNGDQNELLDGTDPIDDPTIEGRLEPKDLDEALDEAARDSEDSGTGGLIDKG